MTCKFYKRLREAKRIEGNGAMDIDPPSIYDQRSGLFDRGERGSIDDATSDVIRHYGQIRAVSRRFDQM